MLFIKRNFIFFLVLLYLNSAWCTEYVPVYMWGTNKINERSQALHKTSEDSLKDTVLEYLAKDPHLIVFVENTLSPEDFAQHNENGESAFPNLQAYKKYSLYKPYVQNPVNAIKQLDKETTEMSIATYLQQKPNVPKDNVLIIYLNDAKEDEPRFDMLKRHDAFISATYNEALEKYGNVLALYTAHHTSWVASGEITKAKKRSLLAEQEGVADDGDNTEQNYKLFRSPYALLYISDLGRYIQGTTNITINDFSADSENNAETNITLTIRRQASDPSFQFSFHLDESGYWYLDSVSVRNGGQTTELNTTISVYAPNRFSYHCGDATFGGDGIELSLPGFQIQPYFIQNGTSNLTIFGDAYDCVGFTSIPIWSGLFVTTLLLLIMTFGLTMMMDIKTMDRFDDSKGKTITINAAE